MNRRTMLGSCLGFLGAFLGVPIGLGVERDVIPVGYMTDKAGNKWRVCKPGESRECRRIVRAFDRLHRQTAQDYKKLRGLA